MHRPKQGGLDLVSSSGKRTLVSGGQICQCSIRLIQRSQDMRWMQHPPHDAEVFPGSCLEGLEVKVQPGRVPATQTWNLEPSRCPSRNRPMV